LLAAMNPVLGVVDVEQDAPGYLAEAVAEQRDYRRHHGFERGRAGHVLHRLIVGCEVRRYGDFRYAAKSWTVERRVTARIAQVLVAIGGSAREIGVSVDPLAVMLCLTTFPTSRSELCHTTPRLWRQRIIVMDLKVIV
jgi:hypothetical protein